MTGKELMAMCPNVPERAIMPLLPEINCYQEVKESVERAAEDGVVCLWPPSE